MVTEAVPPALLASVLRLPVLADAFPSALFAAKAHTPVLTDAFPSALFAFHCILNALLMLIRK